MSYMAVAAVLLLALEVPLGIVYGRHERDLANAGLQRDASALASVVEEPVERHALTDLVAVADHYRSAQGNDAEILSRDGSVVVPGETEIDDFIDPAVRAKVAQVLAGGVGGVHSLRGGESYAVEPIGSGNEPAGAVVLAGTDALVARRVRAAWVVLAVLAAATLVVVAAFGLLVARSVTMPLTHLERVALRFGRGDLAARARQDIGPHEVRSLSGAFDEMAERLQELVSAQQAFVADASHQLRSPLTALRLRLENVAATAPGITASEDMDAILTELDRLSRVVDGLLLLARSEGRRPERSAVDVDAVIEDRCAAWAALAEEAGIELATGDTHGGIALLVPGHLEQILDNLLANAMEATPPGRSVTVAARRAGADVEIHVVDQGRGMGPEERRHAFDRFWRGAASHPGTGSGLGLAIVRQLARASGADVELREAPHGGVDAVVRAATGRGAEHVTANS